MTDTVSKVAAIYAGMERRAKADKIAKQLARQKRWIKEQPIRMERNKAVQAAYRERHGDDLRKARRVATALMGLRRERVTYTDAPAPLGKVAEALRRFLADDEMLALQKELSPKQPRRQRARQ